MNKAFTKESEPAEELMPLPEMPIGVRNYITPRGQYVLERTLQTLTDHATNVQDTPARTPELEQRIHYLRARLDSVEVVDPGIHVGNSQIFFGATVTYENQDGIAQTVTIVGLDETDPGEGRISWLSPVAQALLGAHTGDRVELDGPAGVEELVVTSVDYSRTSD